MKWTMIFVAAVIFTACSNQPKHPAPMYTPTAEDLQREMEARQKLDEWEASIRGRNIISPTAPLVD